MFVSHLRISSNDGVSEEYCFYMLLPSPFSATFPSEEPRDQLFLHRYQNPTDLLGDLKDGPLPVVNGVKTK